MDPAQPIYVSTDRGGLAGLFDHAVGRASVPVLICSPWGWDEVVTYRIRKRWAEHLAAAGHPTLRFDLPAVGDSAGVPGDPDLVEAWIDAVTTMARHLADASGGAAVCGLGLGLGGLLLRAAIERGAPVDQVALWAAPSSGKSFVREARAFARLQTRAAEEVDDPVLPEGWLDVGGFILSGASAAALKALDPVDTGGLRRALLLGRDGVAADAALVDRLAGAGVEVDSAPGMGWGAMVNDARLAELPTDTLAVVDAWLPAAEDPVPTRVEVPRLGSENALHLELGGRSISEAGMSFELGFGRAFGILTSPKVRSDDGPTAVFLNAGNVRHIGPNRLWVEGARRWAAETGRPALRLDLEAIGEADGSEPKEALFAGDVSELYIPPFLEQVEGVLDALQAKELGESFILVGLCAGAYWSFQVAVRDPRVTAAVLLNAGALCWDDDLLADRGQRDAEQAVRGAFDRSTWRRLFRGEIDLRWARRHLGAFARDRLRLPRGTARRPRSGTRALEIKAGFNRLRARETTVLMGFSGGEEMMDDLVAEGLAQRLGAWPQVRLVDLPGSDHTLRSPAAQVAVHELLAEQMRRPAGAAQSGRQR